MYRRIAEDLKAKIESGAINRGDRLPTEIELMEQHNASRNTVRDAIKLLTSLRLVETRAGQGTYVVETINPYVTTLTSDPRSGLGGGEGGPYIKEARESGREPDMSEPRVEVQKATEDIAKQLQIEVGASVVSRHQRRLIDNTPWSLQTSFYPMSLVEGGATRLLQATDIDEGTVVYLAKSSSIKQAGYSDAISVRPPDETETAFFKLPADGRVSVFEIHRLAFDEKGRPFRLTITVYPTDRNHLRINVGEVPSRDTRETG